MILYKQTSTCETKEDVKMNNKWFCLWACPCLYLCVRFPGPLFNVLFISDPLRYLIKTISFPYGRPFSYWCSSIFTLFIYFHLLISYFQQWLYLFIFFTFSPLEKIIMDYTAYRFNKNMISKSGQFLLLSL